MGERKGELQGDVVSNKVRKEVIFEVRLEFFYWVRYVFRIAGTADQLF